MPNTRIHPLYCRCPQCEADRPPADRLAPSARATILAIATVLMVATLIGMAMAAREFIFTWS